MKRLMPLLVGLALLTTPALATELLDNRSVELYHGYALPPHWLRLGNAAPSSVSTNPAIALTGNNALEFNLALGNGPEWAQPPVAVVPGETLRATANWRVDHAFSSGHGAVLLRWWSGPNRTGFLGQVIVQDLIGTATTTGWQQSTVDALVPAGVAWADLTIWGNGLAVGPAGLARFDDVSLRVLDGATATSIVAPANGADRVRLYTVLESAVTLPGATEARLFLSEDRLAVRSADDDTDAPYVDAFPIAGGVARYALTFKPYRRYYWRMDARVGNGAWSTGQAGSFSTGFHVVEDAVGANARRFDAKDTRPLGLDGLDIIENPSGSGYIGVYHNIPLANGQFDLSVATSNNVLNWTYRATLEPNADMGAIQYHAPTGGYFLVHEQWGNPFSTSPSNLRFRYYTSTANLLAGTSSLSYIAPISGFNPSNLEGTPNFYAISNDGNSIDIGFHYFNAGVDRLATGTLTNLVAGTPSWTAAVQTTRNDSLIAKSVTANIGDRDVLDLYGSRYILQEGQYIVGDFGSWRAFFFDEARNDYFPLFVQTPAGSRAFGNMTAGYLRLPGNQRGVVASYFVFSEQSQPGEPGQLIFYHTLAEAPVEPLPATTALAASANPTLRWLAGAGNQSWDVYLGTNSATVNAATTASPEYRGVVARPQWNATGLANTTTYHWRVDGILPNGTKVKSAVWSFTTPAPPTADQLRVF